MNAAPTQILLSGLPGRMCSEVGRLLLEHPQEFPLADFALTGPEIHDEPIALGARRLRAITPARRAELAEALNGRGDLLAVDFSLPDAIEENVAFFCAHRIPFVMGTTGGNGAAIRRQVEKAGIAAVVAPNMAIPIVLVQAAAAWLAETFPGALRGHGVRIRESHQATKKDTSGTAKALVAQLAALGLPASVEGIEKIRDPDRQRRFGVPEEFLGGHAFHTYEVFSPGGDVALSLSHNVLGRRVYAEGTLWAIRFLRRRIALRERPRCHDMLDVLRDMQSLIPPTPHGGSSE
jgi:4-hydroxy-tetrahydrodipicolinate reductase